MSKIIGLTLLFVVAAGYTFAGTPAVPEIDSSSAVSAIVLISGGLLVIRARRKK